MRILVFLLAGLSACAVAQVRVVPTGVQSLLTPSLDTWRKWKSDPRCAVADPEKGHCSQLHDQLDSQLIALSHTKGSTADEALAALFSFGVQQKEGDQSHDLICMAAARGDSMINALKKYRTCTLDISSEYPKSMRSEILACQHAIDTALNLIRTHSGDKVCTWD
jgi:hypothetical protein